MRSSNNHSTRFKPAEPPPAFVTNACSFVTEFKGLEVPNSSVKSCSFCRIEEDLPKNRWKTCQPFI